MQKILPIDEIIASVVSQLEEGNQLILKAPTGAGKSTFLPLRLLHAQQSRQLNISGKILLLEPRRIAAKNIAHFIAKQLGESVGQQVGYRMRGDTKVSAQTKLLIVTEGVLTRMLQQAPELSDIGLIIFDEFHERSIHADTGLAFALDVQEALRDDLKLLIMSATLDESAFQSIMPNASFLESQGRSYPIDIHYDSISNAQNKLESMGRKIVSWLEQESGSALVFLPGQKEIQNLYTFLKRYHLDNTQIHTLYGRQSLEEQERAIMPASDGIRKVVLTTNVAETSLTIDGIRIVFDLGLERVANWDPKSRITKLETKQISKSSAVQRAGRAGRVEAGVCVRFYAKESFEFMQGFAKPEILHTDLTDLALELVQWGVTDVSELAWLDVPNFAHLNSAFDLLEILGITDVKRQLTAAGKEVCQLSLSPRLALMFVKARTWAQDYSQGQAELLSLASLAIATLEQRVSEPSLDIGIALEAIIAKRHPMHFLIVKRAKVLFSQLNDGKFKPKLDHRILGVLLACAYPDRIALKRDEMESYHGTKYSLSNGQIATLDTKSSLAQASSLVALELMQTAKGAQPLFLAAELDLSLLEGYMPQLFVWKNRAYWDDKRARIIGENCFMCGDLVIKTEVSSELSSEIILQGLLGAIEQKGLNVLPWSEKASSLWHRYQWICDELDEFVTPEPMNNTYLLAHIDQWLTPFLNGINSLKGLQNVAVYNALQAWIGWDRVQLIDELAPTHFEVPTGSKIKIRYQQGQVPVLSVRMQEMYGQDKTPKIANGQCALVVELLSPAQRPLQVTQDLASFWQHGYKDVQKEMKGRYPKHIWPDDPAHHQATKKTKKTF